ncbi:GTP-binding nuclear protein gsp1/Ran [Entomortierella beljakovae]|nr:GTP-binding nuclear protein gsp1/Ran [Entomortierella beljakovae]
MVEFPTYKIVLIGDSHTGKTSYIQHYLSGGFSEEYNPTLGAVIRPLSFCTSYGEIKFITWDIPRQERFGGLSDGYYRNANCAIAMFDVTDAATYRSIPNLYNEVTNICGDIPTILCGNKVDVRERKVMHEDITFHHEKNMEFVEMPAITPIDIPIDDALLERYTQELEMYANGIYGAYSDEDDDL